MGAARRIRGADLDVLFAPRRSGGRAVLDLRPAGAGSARPLAGGQLTASCPGRSAAWSEAERCAAKPGPLRIQNLERPRLSGASLRAAPQPGQEPLSAMRVIN